MTVTADRTIYVAEDDITVYKLMIINLNTKMKHPFFRLSERIYAMNKRFHETEFVGPVEREDYSFEYEGKFVTGPIPYTLKKGFHSMTTVEEAINLAKDYADNDFDEKWGILIVNCVVPKGSRYSKGFFSSYSLGRLEREGGVYHNVIVSDTIVPIKIIKD
jgi:hypothetical protein